VSRREKGPCVFPPRFFLFPGKARSRGSRPPKVVSSSSPFLLFSGRRSPLGGWRYASPASLKRFLLLDAASPIRGFGVLGRKGFFLCSSDGTLGLSKKEESRKSVLAPGGAGPGRELLLFSLRERERKY